MKLTNTEQVQSFLDAVNSCSGDVTLTSVYGDVYNLKSSLSQYVAIGALLGEHGNELELWCTDRKDEEKFVQFFEEHPEVLSID